VNLTWEAVRFGEWVSRLRAITSDQCASIDWVNDEQRAAGPRGLLLVDDLPI
jgi:hypothetical protein